MKLAPVSHAKAEDEHIQVELTLEHWDGVGQNVAGLNVV